jgi:hypothetical protein
VTYLVELAWAAGVVDGEGCITVNRHQDSRRRSPTFVLTLKVNMTHEPTVARLHSMLGGWVVATAGRPSRRASWLWLTQARAAQEALLRIQPYLFTKRHEADLALTFYDVENVQQGGGRTTPDHVTAHREGIYTGLRRLKAPAPE